MRILHVIPGVATRYGGPSAAIWPLVSALNGLPEVCAEIATTDADGANARLSRSELPEDVTVHLFRRNWSEQWKLSIGMWRWLQRNVADYDLIHIHGVWSFATAAAARAAESHGTPFVVRPAGMLSQYSWGHRGWKKQVYWRLVESRTLERAAGFHVTSHQEAAEVRALLPNAQVFVIPNGVDEQAFSLKRFQTRITADSSLQERDCERALSSPKEVGVEAKSGPSEGLGSGNKTTVGKSTVLNILRDRCNDLATDVPLVLFLSRLHPKKGIVDRLLPAFVAMQSVATLAIVGEEDSRAPGYEREIRNAIERLGLDPRVTLLGPVYGDDRWSLFDAADVFVLPSHSENFGIVVAEAMARACPVVVTDTVQSCDHVALANAGEIVPGNASELAAALDRVLSNREINKAYGDAGREYAEQHFRWDKIAREIRQMYDRCLRTSDIAGDFQHTNNENNCSVAPGE
jgi:glycosyltransferase involved in cell wall biosynthesis